jgi:hypothetical protein
VRCVRATGGRCPWRLLQPSCGEARTRSAAARRRPARGARPAGRDHYAAYARALGASVICLDRVVPASCQERTPLSTVAPQTACMLNRGLLTSLMVRPRRWVEPACRPAVGGGGCPSEPGRMGLGLPRSPAASAPLISRTGGQRVCFHRACVGAWLVATGRTRSCGRPCDRDEVERVCSRGPDPATHTGSPLARRCPSSGVTRERSGGWSPPIGSWVIGRRWAWMTSRAGSDRRPSCS